MYMCVRVHVRACVRVGGWSDHVVRAGAQQHVPLVQKGERSGRPPVGLVAPHARPQRHRPHLHLPGQGARAQRGGGGGEGEAPHRALVAGHRLGGGGREREGEKERDRSWTYDTDDTVE